jgi:hypothetical protein
MTSHNASDVLASIELGAVLVILVARSVWREFCSRPYVRDKQRAAVIAQHQLLTMPAKKAGAR